MDLFSSAYGQDAPLFVEGGLEDAIAFDDTFNSGGTISVGGFNITIPKNLQVEFPAAYVGWRDFAADKDSMIGYETMVSHGLFLARIVGRLVVTLMLTPDPIVGPR